MAAVQELAPDVGIHAACDALGVVRSSFYRQRRPCAVAEPRPAPARALSAAERETVLAHLHEERFQDCSPAAVQATLLDEGIYHCSTRTMYRILEQTQKRVNAATSGLIRSITNPSCWRRRPMNCGAGISPS